MCQRTQCSPACRGLDPLSCTPLGTGPPLLPYPPFGRGICTPPQPPCSPVACDDLHLGYRRILFTQIYLDCRVACQRAASYRTLRPKQQMYICMYIYISIRTYKLREGCKQQEQYGPEAARIHKNSVNLNRLSGRLCKTN